MLLCYIQCHIVGKLTFSSYFAYVSHSILQWYPHNRRDCYTNKEWLIFVYIMDNYSFLDLFYYQNPLLFLQELSTATRKIWKSCQFSLKMMIIKSVMISFRFGSVIRLIGGGKRGINRASNVDSAKMSIIYWTAQNHWCTWPDQVAKSLTNVELRFYLSTNVSSKN